MYYLSLIRHYVRILLVVLISGTTLIPSGSQNDVRLSYFLGIYETMILDVFTALLCVMSVFVKRRNELQDHGAWLWLSEYIAENSKDPL